MLYLEQWCRYDANSALFNLINVPENQLWLMVVYGVIYGTFTATVFSEHLLPLSSPHMDEMK